MLRSAFLFLGLLGLTAASAVASPAAVQHAALGLARRLPRPGNYVPVYKTYRYHSHQDRPLFSFLHLGHRRPATAKRHHAARRHTSGLF